MYILLQILECQSNSLRRRFQEGQRQEQVVYVGGQQSVSSVVALLYITRHITDVGRTINKFNQ